MRIGCSLSIAVLGVMAFTMPASGAVVNYEETFDGAGTSNAARLSGSGWVNGGAVSSTGVGVYRESGTPVVGDRDGGDTGDGILFLYRPGLPSAAAYTTEQVIDPTQHTTVTFDWDQRGALNGLLIDVRLAVQVGGSWYASSQAFPTITDTAGSPWDDNQLVYDPAAVNWLTLTMGSGTTAPVVGGAASGPLVGNITGFGFVAAEPLTGPTDINETVEFDLLRVTGTEIPEPTSIALLTVAGTGMLRRRRRTA